MTARDQLKTYIEAEARSYLPEQCSFCFPNENNNTAYAEPNPSDDNMFDIAVEWVYSFQIEVSKSLGDQGQIPTTDIDTAMDTYRKLLAKQLKTRIELDANDAEVVKIKSIRSFTQAKEDQNYYIRLTLEYSVLEAYNG